MRFYNTKHKSRLVFLCITFTMCQYLLLMSHTMEIIKTTGLKTKSSDIEQFFAQEDAKQKKFTSDHLDPQFSKATALNAYRELIKPLWTKSMEKIIRNTGLTLKEMLEQYRHRMPEWSHYATYAYDSFHTITGNRGIDPVHVAELINVFEKDGYAFNSGLVNDVWGVVDGQHRLSALKFMKAKKQQSHPFIFNIFPEGDMDEIEVQNTHKSNWDYENHLESWVDLWLDGYIKFSHLYNQRYNKRFPITILLDVLYWSSATHRENFAKKKLEINEQRYNKSIIFLDRVVQLFDTIYPERQKNTISSAWIHILAKLYHLPEFSYKRLIEAVKNPQNIPAFDLKQLTSQTQAIVSHHLLATYNHKLASNRLPYNNRDMLKRIDGWLSTLPSLNIK